MQYAQRAGRPTRYFLAYLLCRIFEEKIFIWCRPISALMRGRIDRAAGFRALPW